MKSKKIYLLLSVIKNNGDVKRLTREGISYQEVAELTNEAIKKGFVIYNEDFIELSSKGLKAFSDLDKKFKSRDKSKWIEEELESKIPRLEKNFIFLPNQNELHFD